MLFAGLSNVVWIRIDGKGSYRISGQLRDFMMEMLEGGSSKFVIDLDRCTTMDSTFMGTLLGISKDVVAAAPDGLVDIVNANGRNVQLLKNLGLTSILSVDEKAERWIEERQQLGHELTPCEDVELDKQATANIMLEAHEALADAQPENVARFQDVIHYLKKDLKVNGSTAC